MLRVISPGTRCQPNTSIKEDKVEYNPIELGFFSSGAFILRLGT